jgi:hypothetical protein
MTEILPVIEEQSVYNQINFNLAGVAASDYNVLAGCLNLVQGLA